MGYSSPFLLVPMRHSYLFSLDKALVFNNHYAGGGSGDKCITHVVVIAERFFARAKPTYCHSHCIGIRVILRLNIHTTCSRQLKEPISLTAF